LAAVFFAAAFLVPILSSSAIVNHSPLGLPLHLKTNLYLDLRIPQLTILSLGRGGAFVGSGYRPARPRWASHDSVYASLAGLSQSRSLVLDDSRAQRVVSPRALFVRGGAACDGVSAARSISSVESWLRPPPN
jgi:hypothetical protein